MYITNTTFHVGVAATGAGMALLQGARQVAPSITRVVVLQDTTFSGHHIAIQSGNASSAVSDEAGRKLLTASQFAASTGPIPLYDASLWMIEGMVSAAVSGIGAQLGCSTPGAGGAACIEMNGAVNASGLILINNTARYGGAHMSSDRAGKI